MKLQFERELAPVTHFEVYGRGAYFLQNRSLIRFDLDQLTETVLFADSRMAGKVSAMQLADGSLLQIASLHWVLSYDLETRSAALQQLNFETFKDAELLLQLSPRTPARQPWGTLFSCCNDFHGTGAPLLYCRGQKLLHSPSWPVFAISQCRSEIAVASGKIALFTAGQPAQNSGARQHAFKARCYAIDQETAAAGSENGELFCAGQTMALYAAGVRGVRAEPLAKDFEVQRSVQSTFQPVDLRESVPEKAIVVLQTNGALFRVLGKISMENGDFHAAIAINQLQAPGEWLECSYCVGGQLIQRRCWFSSDGAEACQEAQTRAVFGSSFRIKQVLLLHNATLCLHADGSLSSAAGRFVRSAQVPVGSALFGFCGRAYCASLVVGVGGGGVVGNGGGGGGGDVVSVGSGFGGTVRMHLLTCDGGMVAAFDEFQSFISEGSLASCGGLKELGIGFLSGVLHLYTQNARIALPFMPRLQLLKPQALAAKEYNCAAYARAARILLCGSEDGFLHAFNGNMALLLSYPLGTSIKSLALVEDAKEELQVAVGCCQNKLFLITVVINNISADQAVFIGRKSQCRYVRTTQNMKYTALASLNAAFPQLGNALQCGSDRKRLGESTEKCVDQSELDARAESAHVLAAGDASGWVYVFLCYCGTFSLLQAYSVGFSVFGIEVDEGRAIVCGSRGVVSFAIDSAALGSVFSSPAAFQATTAQVKHFQGAACLPILRDAVGIASNQVVHATSRGLLASDTGAPYGLLCGVLACLRIAVAENQRCGLGGADCVDLVVGWDRVLRCYRGRQLLAAEAVGIYQIHQVVALDRAIAVIGNGISVFRLE